MSKQNKAVVEVLDDEFLEFYAIMCRTISKPIRLKILHLIGREKKNVSDIQNSIKISLPSLSNHLNDLYRAGVLKKEKHGNYVYYYLSRPELLKSIRQMMGSVKEIIHYKSSPKS
jgi:ArsR family transcriptional regulator